MNRSRQRLGLVGAAVLAAWLSAAPRAARAEEKLNVLFIVVDTLRADALGCYGNTRPASPTLDKLAADGVRFDRSYSYADGTLHSHIALFSSRYAETIEARKVRSPFLAEVFHRNGWSTYGASANPALLPDRGFKRGFDVYTNAPVRPALLEQAQDAADFNAQIECRSAAETTDAVIDMLRTHKDEHPDQPWFMFINYLDPHDPYTARQPWSDAFHTSTSNINGRLRDGAGDTLWQWIAQKSKSLSPADVQRLRELYDAEVRYADNQIARLLAFIKDAGWEENTVVVITGDHGELFGEHGLFTHLLGCYEAELRVPLIVRSPAFKQRGVLVNDLVEGVDVPPTILTLAGLDVPEKYVGRVLLTADGKSLPTRRDFTRHYHWALGAEQRKAFGLPEEGRRDCVVLQRGGLKVYLFDDGSAMVFDERDYPNRKRVEDAAVAKRFAAWARDKVGERDAKTDDAAPDEAFQKALKSLGYVE